MYDGVTGEKKTALKMLNICLIIEMVVKCKRDKTTLKNLSITLGATMPQGCKVITPLFFDMGDGKWKTE